MEVLPVICTFSPASNGAATRKANPAANPFAFW
jgi:hypothetical protein